MLELAKEKRGHFLYHLFCPKGIFLTFVIYLNVYSVLNKLHSKKFKKITLLHTLFCLFLKSSKSLQYILSELFNQKKIKKTLWSLFMDGVQLPQG